MPLVAIGDFNTSPSVPAQRHTSPELLRRLRDEFGIVSAYHSFFTAEHGKEAHATHYWLWEESWPFHLDYCFIPETWASKVTAVEVGGYAEWLDSDHRPLLVDLAL